MIKKFFFIIFSLLVIYFLTNMNTSNDFLFITVLMLHILYTSRYIINDICDKVYYFDRTY